MIKIVVLGLTCIAGSAAGGIALAALHDASYDAPQQVVVLDAPVTFTIPTYVGSMAPEKVRDTVPTITPAFDVAAPQVAPFEVFYDEMPAETAQPARVIQASVTFGTRTADVSRTREPDYTIGVYR